MKKLFVLLILIFTATGSEKEVIAQQNAFGMNFDSPSPYTTQWVFRDVMKQSAEWVIREFEDTDVLSDIWVNQDSISLPAIPTGYPQQVPFEVEGRQYGVTTVMMTNNPAPWYYPSGDYTFIFEGTGTIVIYGDPGFQEFTQSGTHTLTISNPSDGGIVMSVIESDVNDPIRNIQLFMPGFGPDDESVFHPDWMSFLSHFDVIRPMKGLNVEWSEAENWSDRTTPDHYTQYDERQTGMALEYVIDLHNELGRDLYMNLYYRATDDFVNSIATMIYEDLDPELNVYLEYSNETWNSIYPVFEYVIAQGVAQGLHTDNFMAGQVYTAKRSVEIFHIFEQVFGSESDRLIKVMPAWVEFPNIADTMLTSLNDPMVNPNNIEVDKMAIGMYFGGAVGQTFIDEGRNESATVDDMLDSLRVDLETVLGFARAQKSVADEHGVDLITYESGQHLITSFWDPDSALGVTLIEANRNEEMYHIYIDFLTEWTEISGDLNVLFSSVKNYTEFGAFGMKEHLFQSDSDAPKMRAYLDYRNTLSTTNELTDNHPTRFELAQNYPNPFNPSTQINFTLPSTGEVQLQVFDITGRLISTLVDGDMTAGTHSIRFDAQGLASGIYIYRLNTTGYSMTRRMTLIK